jgi:poly(3-hydroxybutyrate) depolymerase
MDAAAIGAAHGGSFTKGAVANVPNGGSNTPYTDSNGKLRTSEIVVSGLGHAWPAGSGGQNSNYVSSTKVNYPAFVMDFWFTNNLRATAIPAPVMTACSASVSGNTATIAGAATDAAGIASYRVVLNGPTPVNNGTAGSGASFSIGLALANGYYTGSVSATSAGTGLTSAPCALAQFLVGPAPALLPPAALTVTATTSTAVSLSWSAASGASGYHLCRNGSKITAAPLTGTSFSDSGLAPATSYGYQASSVGSGGAESTLSAAVTGTTKGACTATTSTNYAHVQAGRAYNSGGVALATGSNQNMGLNNIFYSSTLAQTAPGYWVIGSCP